MSEIRHLTPEGGPSFLILGNSGQDYLQIAGGDGVYVLERRDYGEGGFHHAAAGRPDRSTDRWVDVPTYEAHITVRANEKLELKHVQALARDFIEGRGRSDRFAWRDMTADFG